jgi:hypothetical protein
MRLRALALTVTVAAAGLTGCGAGSTTGAPYDYDAPLKPGEGMLGDATTFRLGEKKEATPAEFTAYQKWKETASAQEREEFEAFRKWQDTRKKTQ